MNTTPTTSRIDPSTLNSDFVQRQATKPLRVCCYGSSSSETPLRYLSSARSLGYILAKRGHTCVNGAGAYGCMAAMNDGADIGEGHIVGVIHEMWLQKESNVRDGGAHQIFLPQQQQRRSTENSAAIQTSSASSNTEILPTTTTTTTTTTSWTGPKHELLVAGGNDLQERKRLLVEKADALIVLPGGPGTWDELWEMACARGIGLSTIPIVCVNCDGYYEPFHEMLVRAYNDRLTKFLPHELVHFEATAEAAVQWVEATCSGTPPPPPATAATSWKKKSSLLRKSSMMHVPNDGKGTTGRWWTFRLPYNHWNYKDSNRRDYEWMRTTILITTGIAFGVTLTTAMTRWIVVKR